MPTNKEENVAGITWPLSLNFSGIYFCHLPLYICLPDQTKVAYPSLALIAMEVKTHIYCIVLLNSAVNETNNV